MKQRTNTDAISHTPVHTHPFPISNTPHNPTTHTQNNSTTPANPPNAGSAAVNSNVGNNAASAGSANCYSNNANVHHSNIHVRNIHNSANEKELPPLNKDLSANCSVNELTYAKETTKSSEKAGFTKESKGSIQRSRKSLNESGCGFQNSTEQTYISISNFSMLKNINNSSLVYQNNDYESLEDLHHYFVLFFQKRKIIVTKLEMEKGKDTIEKDTQHRNSVISVQEEEIDI